MAVGAVLAPPPGMRAIAPAKARTATARDHRTPRSGGALRELKRELKA